MAMSDREDDLRVLLDEASGTGQDRVLQPDDTWATGRRRRTRKRAGAGALGVVALAAVGGLVWQTVLGGSDGSDEIGVATLPAGSTTFVLAAPDATADPPEAPDGLQVPSAEELEGTDWMLRDEIWASDQTSAEVVGSAAETTFSFAGQDLPARGWGFGADDCGGGWFQEGLTLTDAGAFPPGDLATDDQGCLEPAQTAEDFWIDVLSHGGSLHQLGDEWLLLSVDTSWAGVEEPPPVSGVGLARLDFVRVGADPAGVDTSLPERAPSNEELAGTGWTLLEWVDGGGVLGDLTDDPSRLGLRWADDFPDTLVLAYDDCELVTVRTEGVDATGGTVPAEGVETVVEADGQCTGAETASPVLMEAFLNPAQFTLVGDDLLVLRLSLPASDTVRD